MTEIDQDIKNCIDSAANAMDEITDFIMVQHINTGEWPNGFKLCERHSRGMSLLGGLASLGICAAALGQSHTVTVSGALSLREPLKDHLCGLEVMMNKFAILYHLPEPEDEEEVPV